MDVTILDGPHGECDDFVATMADARLCHIPAWTRMIERTFGHRGYYLVARRDGRIRGVLPMMQVRSRLFGNRMISQPFSDYGGVLAAEPEAQETLYAFAVEVARQNRCESIEFRNVAALPYELQTRADKISLCLPLAPRSQEVWQGLRPQIRNRIRKAQAARLTVVSGGVELLDEFYRVWTLRMHELGTPCYPRKLFRTILESFPGAGRIFVARHAGRATAVLFAHTFQGWVQSCWGAALRQYDAIGPNYILNWAAIEHYCARGMKAYDFGRSTIGSGPHTFKARWGARPVPLCWQYWAADGKDVVPARPDDPRYRRKVEMWKRMPLWMSRLLGPAISPGLA